MQSRQPRGARSRLRAGFSSSGSLLVGCFLAAGVALGGCVGDIGDGDQSCSPCDGTGASGPGGPEAQLQTSRFPRLSHLQWENTIRDLFYLTDVPGLSASFTGDPLGGVFDNNEASLLVTPGLWADYQLAAEDLAEIVVSDPAKLAKIVPANAPTDLTGKAKAFIEAFGARAYRRPLTAAESSTYADLFTKGVTLMDGADDFAKGARMVLHAMLQSPHLIYRVEQSSEVKGGLITLSGYEVASKMSYMLWNTMPDDKLFAAAAKGSLGTPEGILAEAQRMLDDERARASVAWFHHQLYQYDHFDDLTKAADLFPDFTSALGADMKAEAEKFIDDVVFGEDGGIAEILTSPYSFVNDKLAPIYGLDPSKFTSEFVKTDLDPKERSGILTQVGFLASNATAREQHSIHRGVFINRRVICADLPDPPNKVPPLPPADQFDTNRERVESHTGKGTCGEACHAKLINPAGFAFEHYDALGQFQTEEKGHPINSADSYPLDGEQVSYDGAIEFDDILAQSDSVQRCYAKYWLEYGYGRKVQEGDTPSLDELGTQSLSGVKPLMLALTQTKAFRTRAPNQEKK